MTVDEREDFLAGLHVGVLAVAGDDGGAPLAVPVWYLYERGGPVTVITGGTTQKARLLRAAGRASLCAQSEDLPYKYVSVEGTAEVLDRHDPDERETIAYRYLPPDLAKLYLEATAATAADSITVRLTPERWFTVDYAKQWG
jgi:PPOX class probable F420-dependent enzyme